MIYTMMRSTYYQSLLNKMSPQVLFSQLLASTYDYIGLNLLARDEYLKALELAKTGNNLEAQAMIQIGLGQVNFYDNKLQDALKWYQQAQNNYVKLGDKPKVLELKQKVNQVKGRI